MKIEVNMFYESSVDHDAFVTLEPMCEILIERKEKRSVEITTTLSELTGIEHSQLTVSENETLREWANNNYRYLLDIMKRNCSEFIDEENTITETFEIKEDENFIDDSKENPIRPEGYKQVCVIEGTYLEKDEEIKTFENWLKDVFNVEGKYLETVKTFPDKDEYGNDVDKTGGRQDLLFVIKNEHVGPFSVPRLQYNIRWLEDVLNNNPTLYPKRIHDLRCW